MIAVVGWPRSGTHWLKAMLEYTLGESVAQSHSLSETVGNERVLIVRDPRDAFASHWRLFQHDHPGTKMTERAFVDYFFKGEGLDQEWGVGWVPHTCRLIQLRLRTYCPLVFYEEMYGHPGKTLVWVLSEMERHIPVRRAMEAVGRTSCVRCDPSTLPVDVDMGSPGKWQRELQPETVQALLEYCGEVMDVLSYAH